MQASNSEAATYKALVKITKIIIIVLPSSSVSTAFEGSISTTFKVA